MKKRQNQPKGSRGCPFKNEPRMLDTLGVSHEKVNEIVKITEKCGCAAKMTGGGKGGSVFVYVPTRELVKFEKVNF